MTYPLIGNYGVNEEDRESARPSVSGFIVREAARLASSWRATESLRDYLVRHGVIGIAEVDTRALTRHIRDRGAMRGGIAPASLPEVELRALIDAHPHMEGLDLACGVSTRDRYRIQSVGEEKFRVIAFDFGVKAHSPKLLSERGCAVTVIPSDSSLEEILAENPDGIFISNGPGDPAAVGEAADVIRSLADRRIPIFGICLGHQLIARAFGASTFKLPFGHHGANHPVRALDHNRVEITSQNHGFAVEALPDGTIAGAPDLRVTHLNLYDGTIEGVEHRDLPVFSVQYHPESAPGPHDSRYLFDRFIRHLEERQSS
jgi:carbamoyl-phosphate synthase small subunit